MIQHVAAWPGGVCAIAFSVPSGVRLNDATALGPVSARTGRPAESKSTPNGTAPGSLLTTGCAEGAPVRLTEKTSTAFVLAFVVTRSCDPSGVNATWPGVCVN